MTIEEIKEAVDFIATHSRKESVDKCGETITNAVRNALGMTVARICWKDKVEEIERLVSKGLSQKQIAEKYGCSQNNISFVMNRFGIEANYHEWTKRDIAGLKNLRAQGWTYKKIGERIGRSYASVCQKVKDLKLDKLSHEELSRRHSKSMQERAQL